MLSGYLPWITFYADYSSVDYFEALAVAYK